MEEWLTMKDIEHVHPSQYIPQFCWTCHEEHNRHWTEFQVKVTDHALFDNQALRLVMSRELTEVICTRCGTQQTKDDLKRANTYGCKEIEKENEEFEDAS
jgi:hypothetical protein